MNVKMFFKFVAWCGKKLWNKLPRGLRVNELMVAHFNETKEHFRRAFVMGFLSYAMSILFSVSVIAVVTAIMYGASPTNEQFAASRLYVGFVLVFETLFYGYCFFSVLYESFLEDYNKVFNILKDEK